MDIALPTGVLKQRMCGNFGLLMLATTVPSGSVHVTGEKGMEGYPERKGDRKPDAMDISLHRSMREVARLRGGRVQGGDMYTLNRSTTGYLEDSPLSRKTDSSARLLNPLEILCSQTSSTEVRGGQAGGISSIINSGKRVTNTRSRCVARKRYPLAADLVDTYKRDAKILPPSSSDVTFIGHTRFATSSVNLVSELHPHEWEPFRTEHVWGLNDEGNG